MSYYHSKVQFPQFKLTQKFSIENFSRFFKNRECTISSIPFNGEFWDFKVVKHQTSMYINIYRQNSYRNVLLQSKILISDSTGKIFFDQSNENFIAEVSFKKFKCELAFIKEESLREMDNTHNDELIIVAEFVLQEMITSDLVKSNYYDITIDAQKSLCQEVLETYENNIYTDVVLNVQGEKINAHKYIICTRSPVFAKMFQQDMAEATKNVVVIKDIDIEVMKELVDFMYSRVNVNYDFEKAVDVYYAADKYEVLKLRERCGEIIRRNINKHNALELLRMADKHKDMALKIAVKNFINTNFKCCVKSSWWLNFANEKSALFEELMDFIN